MNSNKYETVGIYVPHNSVCPRESTDQEKLLIDLAKALEIGSEQDGQENKMFFWYDEPIANGQIIMTFNSKGCAPTFRGDTEDQCLDKARSIFTRKFK
jgi:hypothetical protein